MKFVKGTLASLHASSLLDSPANQIVNTTATTSAIMLYKGAVPTMAEFNTLVGGPNFQDATTTNREPYLNYQDLAEARKTDYLGGVTVRVRPDSMLIDPVTLEIRYAQAMGFTSAFSTTGNTHGTHILASGTPTWFIAALNNAAAINLANQNPIASTAGQIVFGLMGTVGDEKSQADLRILGGQVFANGATLTDQSRSLSLSNLRLVLN